MRARSRRRSRASPASTLEAVSLSAVGPGPSRSASSWKGASSPSVSIARAPASTASSPERCRDASESPSALLLSSVSATNAAGRRKARLSTRWTSAASVVHSCRNPRRNGMTSLAGPVPGKSVRRRVLAAALGMTAVLAVSASAAQARPASTNLSLVAYSTPAGAFGKIIPAFQATPAGKDVTFKQSYGASGPQAAAVHNGLPADVVNLSLAPDVSVLSQAGLVSTTLEQGQVRRHGHRLDRRLRRPQGQPQEHQDVGRPDQAGHPGHQREPVHLGRRALERHGRVGRADQARTRPRSRPTPTSRRSTRTSRCRTRARAPR